MIRMLVEAEDFRRELAQRLQEERLVRGLGDGEDFRGADCGGAFGPADAGNGNRRRCWKSATGGCFSRSYLSRRRTPSWEEAESCLEALKRRQAGAGAGADSAGISRRMPAGARIERIADAETGIIETDGELEGIRRTASKRIRRIREGSGVEIEHEVIDLTRLKRVA